MEEGCYWANLDIIHDRGWTDSFVSLATEHLLRTPFPSSGTRSVSDCKVCLSPRLPVGPIPLSPLGIESSVTDHGLLSCSPTLLVSRTGPVFGRDFSFYEVKRKNIEGSNHSTGRIKRLMLTVVAWEENLEESNFDPLRRKPRGFDSPGPGIAWLFSVGENADYP
ncbi:hypothetical protein HAX54_019992 [Datura stramonium]|uniref:Uncharacterized protein n=1 Tax=Datura stramonium TaxID=4076 RepID=A0ABS8S2Y6_DATST|nr:hypothetical protein [Datura stramonium]